MLRILRSIGTLRKTWLRSSSLRSSIAALPSNASLSLGGRVDLGYSNKHTSSSSFATFSVLCKQCRNKEIGREDVLGRAQFALVRHLRQLGKEKNWPAVHQALEDAAFPLNDMIYSVAINAMVYSKQWLPAIYLLEEMKGKGLTPTLRTYCSVIEEVCGTCGHPKVANQVVKDMLDSCSQPDCFTYHMVIHACGKSRPDLAAYCLNRMVDCGLVPDNITYALVVKAYAQAGDADKALYYMRKMEKRNLFVNVFTYTYVINAYGVSGDWPYAVDLYEEMRRKGIVPTPATLDTLFNACAKADNAKGALYFYMEFEKYGLVPDTDTYAPILDALRKKCSHRRERSSKWLRKDRKRGGAKTRISRLRWRRMEK